MRNIRFASFVTLIIICGFFGQADLVRADHQAPLAKPQDKAPSTSPQAGPAATPAQNPDPTIELVGFYPVGSEREVADFRIIFGNKTIYFEIFGYNESVGKETISKVCAVLHAQVNGWFVVLYQGSYFPLTIDLPPPQSSPGSDRINGVIRRLSDNTYEMTQLNQASLDPLFAFADKQLHRVLNHELERGNVEVLEAASRNMLTAPNYPEKWLSSNNWQPPHE